MAYGLKASSCDPSKTQNVLCAHECSCKSQMYHVGFSWNFSSDLMRHFGEILANLKRQTLLHVFMNNDNDN